MQRTQLQLVLDQFLATRSYYPCCILAHTDVRQLQQAADFVLACYHWPLLSIGTALSAALLSMAPPQRARAAHTTLVDAIRPLAPGPLIIIDIDLLFEPSLALEPLRLLRDMSRLATLIVFWPGAVNGDTLSYAVPIHHHHRSWSRIDLPAGNVVPL